MAGPERVRPLEGAEAVADLRESDAAVPLVVDLDACLARGDPLVESVFGLAARAPASLLKLPGWRRAGRGVLAARLAEGEGLDVGTLPLDEAVLARLRAEKARGRRLYLVSALDAQVAGAVADRTRLFDGHFGSTEGATLAGAARAEALAAAFGAGGFDYLGGRRDDAPVWAAARRALAANHGPAAARGLAAARPDHEDLGARRTDPRALLRALRPHQWAKNGLIFLPMLTAHAVSVGNLALLVVAFAAFSAVASAVYLVNDLFDLPSDRVHATKRFRPLASGAVPAGQAVLAAPLLLLLGVALAAAVSPLFLAILLGYFTLTLAYSMVLKRKAILDVMTLAGLYTVRVLAGAAALMIPVSEWLLAFSVFVFLALALVKRQTELRARIDAGKGEPAGRGYRLSDIDLVRSLASSSSFAAVVVFALYISSPTVQNLYPRPEALWLVCGLLLYWLARVLLVTDRGEMHDDPVVFALRDGTSRIVLVLVVAIVLAASSGL